MGAAGTRGASEIYPVHYDVREAGVPTGGMGFMLTELINESLLRVLTETPQTPRGRIAPGWSISLRETPTTTSPPYTLRRTSMAGAPAVEFTLREHYPWFRLEQEIAPELITAGHYRFAMSYESDHQPGAEPPRIKILEYSGGIGQTFANIALKLAPSRSPHRIQVDVDIPTNSNPGMTYRLAFEFRSPVTLTFSAPTLARLDGPSAPRAQGTAPYRSARSGVGKALVALNDNMDRELRQSPGDWLGRMLRVSVDVGDADTAIGIARYVENRYRGDLPVMREVAAEIVDALVAFGDLDQLSAFLVAMSNVGIVNDRLVAVGRWFGQREDHDKPVEGDQPFALPSGAPDLFNLNLAVERNRVSFDILVRSGIPENAAALVWANYLRHRSTTEYIRQLNLFMEGHDCPYEIDGGEPRSPGISLERLRFKEVGRPSRLWGDGPLVSVIITAPTLGPQVIATIRATLEQTYRHLEILVGCPGGDGVPQAACAVAEDERVRLFHSPGGQGVFTLRNQLAQESSGELITFQNTSDLSFPHRISAQVTEMAERGALACLATSLRIKPGGHIMASLDGRFVHDHLDSLMLTRSTFDNFGYRDVSACADQELLGRLADKLGAEELVRVAAPLVMAHWVSEGSPERPWIDGSTTRSCPPPLRTYLSRTARHRILGEDILPYNLVEEAARSAGILRSPHPLIPTQK